MTIEEKFNQDVWHVLKRIKERSLYAQRGTPAEYSVNFSFIDLTGSNPRAQDEINILGKLGEWGVIKTAIRYQDETEYIFSVEIIQPKFDELYRLYENSFHQKRDPKKIFEMVQRWVDPARKDGLEQFEIWETINGEASKHSIQADNPASKILQTEFSVGELGAYNDGSIRYKDVILELRNQLKDLCRLFMEHHKRLVTIDDIREAIINADKRKSTSNATIAKYVSELRNSLKIHFKRDVIFNQKEEGWYLQI